MISYSSTSGVLATFESPRSSVTTAMPPNILAFHIESLKRHPGKLKAMTKSLVKEHGGRAVFLWHVSCGMRRDDFAQFFAGSFADELFDGKLPTKCIKFDDLAEVTAEDPSVMYVFITCNTQTLQAFQKTYNFGRRLARMTEVEHSICSVLSGRPGVAVLK